MERVLKAVPADLRVKMEALVHDLTLALEESSNSANLRRRWGIRRRARSTGNIRKCKEHNIKLQMAFFCKALYVGIAIEIIVVETNFYRIEKSRILYHI